MKRILVGTDFSPLSRLAVDAAAGWARQEGAALRVVHVLPPGRWLTGSWGMSRPTVSMVQRRADTALQKLAETIARSGAVEISTEVFSGAASVQLARAAVQFGADLLVTGTRGEHDLARRRVTLDCRGGTRLGSRMRGPVTGFETRAVVGTREHD